MSKTIVSVNLIGPTFMDVLFREIASIATEKEIDPEIIQQEIMGCGDMMEVNKVLRTHFKNELKIRE
jgi:hypothetical protein